MLGFAPIATLPLAALPVVASGDFPTRTLCMNAHTRLGFLMRAEMQEGFQMNADLRKGFRMKAHTRGCC